MRHVKYHRTICLLLAILTICGIRVYPARGHQDTKKVLILHSYHKAEWTDSLLEGIHSELDSVANLEMVVEYMDTKRLKTEAYYRALDEIYRLKYSQTTFDVVLTSDDNAYRYALAHHEGLFRQAPIVFCGVNRFDPHEIENRRRVPGVVADLLGWQTAAAASLHMSVVQVEAGQDDQIGHIA